jgi:hypothetical protein
MLDGTLVAQDLRIPLPAALNHYRTELLLFFAGMIYKLNLNAHKDAPNKPQIPELMLKLMGEVGELTEQILKDKFDPNSLQEAFDTANFAFLIYLALLRDGTKDPRRV